MAGIKIKIDKEQLVNVETVMAGIKKGYKKVLVTSLNKTVVGVRKDTSDIIKKIVTLKVGIIKRSLVVDKANYVSLSARLSCTGWPVPLIFYAARKTIKKGVTFQIRKKDKRSYLKGSFIATVKAGKTSEHKGVFWRVYRDTHISKPVDKQKKYSGMPKIYRLPIRQRYGPAVPDIMDDKDVMEPILKKAGDRLSKEIDHRLKFEMSKL